MKHVQHLNTQHRNQGWKMLVQFLFCIDFGTKPNWWHAVCCPMHRLGMNHWQLFPFEYTGDMAFYETWHKCRSARAHATGHNGNQLREQLLFGVWLLLGTPLLSRQKWQHAWSSFTVYFFRSLVDVVVDMQNGFVLLFLRFEFFFCIKYEKKHERNAEHSTHVELFASHLFGRFRNGRHFIMKFGRIDFPGLVVVTYRLQLL